MNFAKDDVIAIHAELTAARERVHTLMRVWDLTVSHKLDRMNHLRLLEKFAAWRRTNGFDMSEVLTETQHRAQGHTCSVDDPEHYKTMYILTHDGLPHLNNVLKVCGQR